MIIYLFTFSYNFIVHYIYKIKLGTIPILNETSNKRTNPNRLVTNTNNKIEERYAWNNDRFKYDRGRKNRNDFIIVVAIAGIFHGCIGGEIFPLLFRTVQRTHAWWSHAEHASGSVSSIFPPRFFLLFSWCTPAGGFRRKPVYVPRREFEDISTRKARQFHTASIREKYTYTRWLCMYINFVENPPVFRTKF